MDQLANCFLKNLRKWLDVFHLYDFLRCSYKGKKSKKPAHSKKWNIYLNSSLWCRGKERRLVPPLSTQCLQNSAESRKRSVLALGFLCLACCVRDTAWSWSLCHNFIFVSYHIVVGVPLSTPTRELLLLRSGSGFFYFLIQKWIAAQFEELNI